jgi:hypothetical protein
MTTEENEMNVLEAINYRMNGGGCPGAGSLGECAAITSFQALDSATPCYIAHLYLWSGADDLTSAEVARWFHELGATDVVVSAVLFDHDNDVLNGACVIDGARPWDVSYLMPENVFAADARRCVIKRNLTTVDGSMTVEAAVAGVVGLFPGADVQALRCLGELMAKTPNTVVQASGLMDAAPDLLKALQEVVAISDRKHDAWDRAHAAIAKALG